MDLDLPVMVRAYEDGYDVVSEVKQLKTSPLEKEIYRGAYGVMINSKYNTVDCVVIL